MARTRRLAGSEPDNQLFRRRALGALTTEIGVYALCDLDETPIYVGQSVDGIRARVNRHLTSARSDIIANRQIDVWEIAYVKAWPVNNVAQIARLEAILYRRFRAKPDKKIVDGQAASPSSWKTPFIATCMVW